MSIIRSDEKALFAKGEKYDGADNHLSEMQEWEKIAETYCIHAKEA